MRNPMNKRFFRELKSDFGKYLVIFLFIVMVVSVVSSFLVANAGVAEAYYGAIENNNVENGHFSFNIKPDDELLNSLAEKSDITLYPADYFEETNNASTLRVYSLGTGVNLPSLCEGRLPEGPGEIALDNLHTLKANIKVGDSIPVDGHIVKVTGLVAVPNYSALFKDNSSLMFDNENFGIGLMTKEGFEDFSSDHITISYAWKYNNTPKSDKEKRDASEKVLTALREELVTANTEIVTRAMMGEEGLTMLEVKDYLPDYENKSINFAGEDMGGDSAAMEVFL
ncbi:MAG: ABC transporter permease, partial [Lachnospiraceae bacterium]|nr:ABC transporter permease [Lachnospiraceae bacterium]